MSKVNLNIGEREVLPDRVVNVLRKAIMQGDFAPGDRLVQADLAESMGVSRMPIREALRTLENEGLVTIIPHKGAVVRTMEIADIEEIYELRAVLEPMALRKNREVTEPDIIRELQAYQDRMKSAKQVEDYIEANKLFHDLLMAGCEMPRLLGMIESVARGFPFQTPQLVEGRMKTILKEHDKIIDALKNKEIDEAADCLTVHIQQAGAELIFSLEKNRN